MLGSMAPPDAAKPWANVAQGLYVYVPDSTRTTRARKRPARSSSARLADTPYGSREYAARDSEGNIWGFGTYYPGRGVGRRR